MESALYSVGHITRESLADASVTRDSVACMKAPVVEILSSAVTA